MVRLKTYAVASLTGAVAVIYHAFNSRGQFYPATVYLSTSKISLVLLLNMGLVIMCGLWQLVKLIFLGPLREVEVERLNDQSWREVMEILLAITIFRQEFSVSFLAMVTALLLIKSLHWLAQKRVEYIETTPSVSTFSHIRIISFLVFLLFLDCVFLYSSVSHLLQTRQASVSLFFSFEYMILATTTVSTFLKYVFYVSDMLMEGQWERKAVYTFYLELVRDLLHLSLYLFFFLVIFLNYGLPLHLIREFYDTFRNFKSRVADYVRYRKITSNMNDRFPDVTPEELNASDATCIICREEMVTGKKLLCGHIFHVHCLRSWLERQQTCPTCRSLVVPSNGTTGTQPDLHPNGGVDGSGTAGAAVAGPGGGATSDNLSQHQARLQAAAAAASVYGKSYVYPPANTFIWSPGYALVPQIYVPGGPAAEASSGENIHLTGETASPGNAEQHKSPNHSGHSNFTFPQTLHCPFTVTEDVPEGRRLYVGNLPYSVTKSELQEIFSEAGRIESVEVVYDRVTDRSRGFGFVTMGSVEEAKEAIRMFDGSQVGGRSVKVNFPEVPRGAEREVMGPRIRHSYRGFVDSPFKVYAGNLGWRVTSEILKDAFEGQPGLLSAKVLYDKDTGKSRGYGFLSFTSSEEAQSAIIAMNGVDVEGRSLRLNLAVERERSSALPLNPEEKD